MQQCQLRISLAVGLKKFLFKLIIVLLIGCLFLTIYKGYVIINSFGIGKHYYWCYYS